MSFLPIIKALNDKGVSYVAVGGLAVVLHGHPRLTLDVDLVVKLDPDNALKAVETLSSLGYRPRAPVDPKEFADPEKRGSWIREKGLMVFSFFDPKNPVGAVDLFVDYPMEYGGLLARSETKDLGGMEARICSLADLIAMKKKAGRPKDLEDVRVLEIIQSEKRKRA